MKVLVYPGRRFQGNPYFPSFCDGLNNAGCSDIRLMDVFTKAKGFDVIHFHFPEFAVVEYSPIKSTFLTILNVILLLFAKIANKPVIWMVHDLTATRTRRKLALSLFMRFFRWCVSGYVFLNESSQEAYFALHPRERAKPVERAPHGRYNTSLVPRVELDSLRSAQGIGLDDCLISFLGTIKPYKSLDALAKLPTSVAGSRRVRIAVCGQVDHGVREEDVTEMLARSHPGGGIRKPERLSDVDLGRWVQMSDAVFMPYKSGTNSGFALFVLSNHGRILSSGLPMFREIEIGLGKPWICTTDTDQPNSLATTIEDLCKTSVSDADRDRLEKFLDTGDYKLNGMRLSRFYKKVISDTRGRQYATKPTRP